MEQDEYFMRVALQQAQQAMQNDEIPIGAVITHQDHILGKGYNQTERLQDATAHAEMLAITAAAHKLGSKYLPECTLYVTIEPCPMCAAASNWAQIGRIVFGADDLKKGYTCYHPGLLHPKTTVTHGVLEEECRRFMTDFFAGRREE